MGILSVTPAQAVPTLQLDIIGGHYDAATQTVISDGAAFALVAYGTPGSTSAANLLAQTFYISAALVPRVNRDAAFDAGSFSVDGSTIDATAASLSYGTPPNGDGQDLGSHGIYETYYREIAFTFGAANTATAYNTQDNAGGALFDTSGNDMFFKLWSVNVAGLDDGYELHFDLYNADRTLFAPLSHDAESGAATIVFNQNSDQIPEPGPLAVLGLGLAGLGFARRRRAA